MGSIMTAIQLTDRMSSPIQTIVTAINSTVTALEEVQAKGGSAFDSIDLTKAKVAINQANAEMEELAGGIENAKTQQDNFNASASKMNGVVGTVTKLAGAFAGIVGIKKLVSESDELAGTMARLNNMNDGAQTTQQLYESIVDSANNARGSVSAMADVVAKFGNNAKGAFKNSAEVVQFSEIIQKQMKIAGASGEEASNAMLQLSQALGSGTLRGDELNSIFEQAPNLIQSIADYMDVPIGQIRQLASEGQITSDIVKNAIMASADDVNERFESMPMTWGDVWQRMENNALVALQPVLDEINVLANDSRMQSFANGFTNAMQVTAGVLGNVLDVAAGIGGFVADNWGVLEPILWGVVGALGAYLIVEGIVNTVNAISAGIKATKAAATLMETGTTFAATVAQKGFNAALAACPITWIIAAILAVIVILFVACNAIAKTTGAAKSGLGIIVGALAVAGAFIANLVIGLINAIIDWGVNLYNLIGVFANFIGNVFDNPVRAVANLFIGVFTTIIGVVKQAASVIDAVVGTNFANKLESFSDNIQSKVDAKYGKNKEIMKKINSTDLHVHQIEYGKAWQAGRDLGDKGMEKLNGAVNSLKGSYNAAKKAQDSAGTAGAAGYNQDAANTAKNTKDTAKNTARAADALDVTSENLKYIRDYAAQKSINRYTSTQIKVDMTNNNRIDSEQDIDGIVTKLKDRVQEEMLASAEGVM